MRLIDEKAQKGLPCETLSSEAMRAATSKLSAKILELLTEHEGLHSSEIARMLNMTEQKIYYHTRKLKQAGIIVVDRIEDTSGGMAKVLRLTSPSYAITFNEMEPWQPKKTPEQFKTFLSPFIVDGKWNARIVVGSPDPHGPESARGKDASYAIDLALFLGQYLETPPKEAVVLDTELSSWKQNLIIIGGPVVNKAAERVGNSSLVVYDAEKKAFRTNKGLYGHENTGIIVKMPNPFAKGKCIILIQGIRFTGTKAAILTFLQQFQALCKNCKKGSCGVVVQGLDIDSDGIVDAVKILE